jgi:cell division transport system permease protein
MVERSMRGLGKVWRSGRGDLKLYLLSIFSLTVSFVCVASALLVVVNLRAIEMRWSRAGRVSVYLRDGVSDDRLAALQRALEQTPDVVSSRYVSPQEARTSMVEDGPASSLAALPAEAFPATIELTLSEGTSDDRVSAMAEKLRALPSVESVETYQRWTERIARLLRGGVSASAVLALVVLVAVASVIGSTMRFALHRRRIEIEVLKLVGASDRFVRRPFLVEGAAQGALGAAASLVLLGVLYLIVRAKFDEELGLVFGVHPTFLPWEIALAVVAMGGLLGTASAWAGVRRLSAE